VAESCTGSSGACPAEGFQSATTICRQAGANPDCNPAESCTGNGATCPDDTGDECLNFEDAPKVVPTGTTCQQYRDGTSSTLGVVDYLRKGNQPISSVSPGVFFLYDGLRLSAGSITIVETPTLWPPRIPVNGFQVILYDLSCNVVRNYSNDATGLTLGTGVTLGDVTITGVLPGDYILSVKYDPTVLKGCTAAICPNPSTTYNFAVVAGVSSSGNASVLVQKKVK
jgi:hypothetical protein